MFCSIQPPMSTFAGYRVFCFRQTRTNLAERTLRDDTILFVPAHGGVGVFLPRHHATFTADQLLTAWEAQHSPAVHRLKRNEFIFFGRPLPFRLRPFTGYNDTWLDQETSTLIITFRREASVSQLHTRLNIFCEAQLKIRAQMFLDKWSSRLLKYPSSLVIKPLRPAVLGQCLRTGEIRLSSRLCLWPESIVAETLAHELIHLHHFNHSPNFWRALTAFMPDWLPRALVHYLPVSNYLDLSLFNHS